MRFVSQIFLLSTMALAAGFIQPGFVPRPSLSRPSHSHQFHQCGNRLIPALPAHRANSQSLCRLRMLDPTLLTDVIQGNNIAAGALGVCTGTVLGLLGGGGSILALPIFLYVFQEPTQTAIAESLVVVSIGAAAGLLAKVQNVRLPIALPFAVAAMTGSFITAKYATSIPPELRLAAFTAFAVVSSVSMWQSASDNKGKQNTGPPPPTNANSFEPLQPLPVLAAVSALPLDSLSPLQQDQDPQSDVNVFTPALAAQAMGVGALTSIIGAGGGFVIMPSLILAAKIEVKEAVASSLLIIFFNSASAFTSYVDQVPIHWNIVVPFAGTVAGGALLGSLLANRVSQQMVKRLFSGTVVIFLFSQVLTVCTGVVASCRHFVQNDTVQRQQNNLRIIAYEAHKKMDNDRRSEVG